MTLHTPRGPRQSVKQDDGYGNLITISFASLVARIVTGWREL